MVFWRRGAKAKDASGGAAAAEAAASGGSLEGTVGERFGGTAASDATRLPAGDGGSEASEEESEDDGAELGARPPEIRSEAGEDVDEDVPEEDDEDFDEEGHEDGEEEEEEEDIEVLWENFEANLAAMHPKLQDTRGMVTDHELLLAVQARRNPAVSDNARFIMGARPADSMGRLEVPPLIGVTGHRGPGGNIGINGIYELYPGTFHDRPVYQKVLEKRSVSDLVAAPPGGLVASRDPLFTPRSRLEAKRSQRALIVKAPKKQLGLQTMWPVPNAWFLFFDKGIGCWCIGPAVGHTEVFARCPGAEELIPDRLDRWQVWDCGLHQWYDHQRLITFKGGATAK